MMGCISDSERPISMMEKSPEVIVAAPAVMDVRYASAVIHSSSADPVHASASSQLEAHLGVETAMAVENISTAECKSDVSTVHGASGNIGKA